MAVAVVAAVAVVMMTIVVVIMQVVALDRLARWPSSPSVSFWLRA